MWLGNLLHQVVVPITFNDHVRCCSHHHCFDQIVTQIDEDSGLYKLMQCRYRGTTGNEPGFVVRAGGSPNEPPFHTKSP